MNTVIDNIRVNGKGIHADLAEQVIDGELKLSTAAITSFDFTVLDREDLRFTGETGALLKEGTTILWDDYALTLTGFETGGGTQAPTVAVSATSDFVRGLKEETGGHSWGNTDVSAWAKDVILRKGAVPYVQPNLGERDIERKEPEGDGDQEGESTWDVLVEMAKQTGAWLFEYGSRVVLARPSWLVNQTGVRKYTVRWDSWTDHTDALTAAPQYSWNKDRKPYNGQEQVTIQALDPPGSTLPLSMARPGDILEFTGKANPTEDPLWVVVSVTHRPFIGTPVAMTAWRPIDPPEIIPESEGSNGDSTGTGVPVGPLGKYGWQGEQLKNATEIVKEAQRRGMPLLAQRLAVCCAMGESSLRNIGYGDVAGPDSRGLFQQRDSWGPLSERLSPGKAAGFFLAALAAQPYQSNYDNGANSLPSSNIGSVYIGPGKSENSASVTIHRVQINADPYHYAKFWGDAQTVVDAIIEAGKDDNDTATGPLKQRIQEVMAKIEGEYWDLDGAHDAQCVDGVAKYIQELFGIPMIQANGKDYYNHPGLKSRFTAFPGFNNPRKGDVVTWAGTWGAYPNGGYGHVAVYDRTEGGTHYFQSQNPTPMVTQPLQVLGIVGIMRPKG